LEHTVCKGIFPFSKTRFLDLGAPANLPLICIFIPFNPFFETFFVTIEETKTARKFKNLFIFLFLCNILKYFAINLERTIELLRKKLTKKNSDKPEL